MIIWVLRKLTEDKSKSHTDFSSVLTCFSHLGLIFSQPKLLFSKYGFCRRKRSLTFEFLISAQSMSRAAAGFFAPYHGMWGFSNSSSSQKYSGLGSASNNSGNNFGYPPTPPKDSGTPDQQISEENNGYHHMNNNTLVQASSSDTKPSTEHLMSSISSLSAYAGLPSSASSKRLPEGTNSSQQYSNTSTSTAAENSMFYYPTSSDLAMYGSSSYGNRTLQSSRPKSKNRSNAGKRKIL